MNIHIMSLDSVLGIIEDNKKGSENIPIVSIRDSFNYKEYEQIDSYFKRVLPITFDDTTHEQGNMILATEDKIKSIFDWCNNKNNIIVHCTAGVSRSSAIAYLIKCKYDGIDDALKILNISIHEPNSLIVRLGSMILKDYNILTKLSHWKENELKNLELNLSQFNNKTFY